jgi:nucleoside-triphosphatase THEP1
MITMDAVGVSALRRAVEQCELAVIDEIGRMELFSTGFSEAIWRIVCCGKKVLGTIMLNPNPWADAIKLQPMVNLISVTRAKYDQILSELWDWLRDET